MLVAQLITLDGRKMALINTNIALKSALRLIFCFCQVKKDFESSKGRL